MHDWRWFVAVWAIAAALLVGGLVAIDYAALETGFQGLNIGR